jgi:aspartate aminotransferase
MSRISVSATAAMMMEAEKLRNQGADLVDFGAGEPDFSTPEHIKAAAVEALRQNFTKYTNTGGILPLKQAIAQTHARDFGSSYAPDEVLVTVGGKHALFNAISAVVDHGDEVILSAPYWVSFSDMVTYAGGVPIVVQTDESRGFLLTADMVRERVTPRTKLIILNSPNNPSGAIFPASTFRGVLELCRERGIWLISDECYAKFVYDGASYSVASEPESKDWLIVAGSLSKTYAMTGWRLGYALAPKALIKQMLNLQSHSTSNPTSFVQKAAVAALTGPQEPVAAMLAEYRRRRDLIVARLNEIAGVRCAMPAGAFYAYPNIGAFIGRGGIGSSIDFATRLLHDAGLVTVPGEAFGTSQHVRFSYATSVEQIEKGMRRLAVFCQGRTSA